MGLTPFPLKSESQSRNFTEVGVLEWQSRVHINSFLERKETEENVRDLSIAV